MTPFVNHFIMKVTSNCNLACRYCQYRSRLTKENKGIFMNEDVLEKSISQILSLPIKRCTFIWHGGEPLLADKKFYESVIRFQKQNKKEDTVIVNAVQTNATLLDSAWIEFFRKNNFSVDISLDGPSEIHNLHRIYPDGRGSFSDVARAVKILKENKIEFGIIATVTKESVTKPKEVYSFLKSQSPIFDLQPVEINTDVGEEINTSIDPKEFANFMFKIFDYWWEENDPNVHIRYFEDLLIDLLGGTSMFCQFIGACNNLITIDVNGDVYPCDNFIGYQEFKFGNILQNTLQEILQSDKYKLFVKGINTLPSECPKCKYYQICKGGCPYHRYMFGRNFSNKNYFCEAQKLIFAHVEKRVKELLE